MPKNIEVRDNEQLARAVFDEAGVVEICKDIMCGEKVPTFKFKVFILSKFKVS